MKTTSYININRWQSPYIMIRHQWVCVGLLVSLIVGASSCTRSQPLSPDAFQAELRRIEGLVGLGKFEPAVDAYQRLAAREPLTSRSAALWVLIGQLYAGPLLRRDLALIAFGKAAEMAPLSEAARVAREQRAGIFEEEGVVDAMIEEYARLVKYYPEHERRFWYRLRMAEGFLIGKRYQEARAELEVLGKMTGLPEDIREHAFFDLGESYFLDGSMEKAGRTYISFLKQYPKSTFKGEVDLRIAACAEELGYLGTAYQFAADARDAYPNKEVVESRLKSLEQRGTKPQDKSQPQDKSVYKQGGIR